MVNKKAKKLIDKTKNEKLETLIKKKLIVIDFKRKKRHLSYLL